jgi:hypothetical protein
MKISLTTNPARDLEFQRYALALLASDGIETPAGLQRLLRADYPDASVSSGIAELGVERWYAYREGHWIDGGARPAGHQAAGGDSDGNTVALRMTS